MVLFTNGFPQTGPILSPCITLAALSNCLSSLEDVAALTAQAAEVINTIIPPLQRPLQYFKFIDLIEKYRKTSPISELNL